VISGEPTVLINGRPAARIGDRIQTPRFQHPVACVGGPILSGSSTVFIGGMPAARLGDPAATVRGPGTIVSGSPNVLIGN
jgi:hypothetical protein